MKYLLIIAMLALSGCGESRWEYHLREQAGFIHDCPMKEIKTISSTGGNWASYPYMYVLDVCGKHRKYIYSSNKYNGGWYEIQ